MFRRLFLVVLLLAALAWRSAEAQETRQGTLRKIDIANRTVVVRVGAADLEMTLTDETRVPGGDGRTLAEKLSSFTEGSEVVFRVVERRGRRVVLGMRPAAMAMGPPGRAAHGAAAGDRGSLADVPDLAELVPLDRLGNGTYRGHTGGLYPDGRNQRPKEHEAAGLKLAAQVRPLDAGGRPHPEGRIVLLSLGMSNASQAWQGFQLALGGYARRNPRLLVVDGAQSNMTAATIRNPDDGGRGTLYWAVVDRRLEQASATPAQVQAVWLKQANFGPRAPFPAYARQLQSDLMRIAQIISQRFPNARLAYVSSRSYAGDSTGTINPEPFAYESGFAVKWLIEEQLEHNSALNFDESRGAVTSPWLSWGPYLWANRRGEGATGRTAWERADFAKDGTHLSRAGQRKAGLILLEFFGSDSTAAGWFNQR